MKISNKLIATGLSAITMSFGIVSVASAHVVVKPGEVLTGSFQTFSIGVPVEKDIAATNIKLEIPAGLTYVTPTIKPGWTIQTEKEGTGEEATVKSITWSGGEITAGFRDDFTFAAKVPGKPTDLQWKAYQTYADGSMVEWNLSEGQQPKKADGSPDFSKSGPFSVTKVVSETATDVATKNVSNNTSEAQQTANRAMYIGIGGLILGLVAIFLATRKKA